MQDSELGSTNQLIKLQELKDRRSALNESPGMVVGNQLRLAVNHLRAALSFLLRLPRTVRAMRHVAPTDGSADPTFTLRPDSRGARRRFPVDERHVYAVEGLVTSKNATSKAALLQLAYANVSGEVIGYQEVGFTYSVRLGYYKYLPGDPQGRAFSYEFTPPADAHHVSVILSAWQREGAVDISELDVQELELAEAYQHHQLLMDLDRLQTVDRPGTVLIEGFETSADGQNVVDRFLRAGYFVIFEYPIMKAVPRPLASQDNVYLISKRMLQQNYRRVSALEGPRRVCVFAKADFYAVLQANYFAHAGWSIATEFEPHDPQAGSAAKRAYLKKYEDLPVMVDAGD